MCSTLGVWSMFRPSICAPPFRHFNPHFIRDSIHCSRIVSRMGFEENNIRGGGLDCLRVLAVFRENMLRALEISTGSALLILWILQPFRMPVLWILLAVLGVLCCSSSPSTRSIWAFSTRTAHTSPVLAVFRTPHTWVQYSQHQQYPEYRTRQYCQHRQHRKNSIERHTYEHTVPCSSIMHRHTYLQ